MIKKFYMALITILCSIGITIAVSYAWFLHDENVNPIAQGRSGEAYFAYGDGTTHPDGTSHPYGINTPRHLYNLAWLTYLYPEDYADKDYEIDPSLNGSLNMRGWTLPPIGKDNAAFTGTFDGNGKTIANLTTSNNTSDMSTKPNNIPSSELINDTTQLTNAKSIGFFGNISGNGSTQVHDFYLQNTTVKTATSSTCIGIVAGYVDGKIENVGVVSSGLDLGNTAHSATHGSNISDYTVVGYATEDYTTTVANSKTVVYNATTDYDHFTYRGMGNTTAWGGSIDFKTLHERINGITSFEKNFQYTYQAIKYANTATSSKYSQRSSSDQSYSTSSGNYYTYKYNNTAKPENGSYVYLGGSNTPGSVIYLSALYQNVYLIEVSGQTTGYKIHDGNGHYLNVQNAENGSEITIGTSVSTATIWHLDSDGLYVYNDLVFSENIKYYLNGTTELDSELSTTSTTSWEWDGNTFRYNYNGVYYHLNYINNAFAVGENYVITDGVNYLVNNNGVIGNTTTANQATVWNFIEPNDYPYGYLVDHSNSTQKLAIDGNSLTTTNNGSYWYFDGSNLISGNKVVGFDGSNWVLDTLSSYYIQYNGHYLRYNGSLGDTTDKTNGTLWSFSNTLINVNGNGTISCTIGNDTYYLRYYNGLSITNDINYATTWYQDSYGFYVSVSNTRHYIQYDGTWKVAAVKTKNINYPAYFIKRGNNYLSMNSAGTGYTNQTSETNATKWIFNGSGSNIYTIKEGINYYLFDNGSYVGVSTSKSNITWTLTANNYLQESSTNQYINRSGTTWYCDNDTQALTLVSTTLSVSTDDYENTPFGRIGLSTNYVSRCDAVQVNLSKVEEEVNEYTCEKIVTQSDDTQCYIPLKVDSSLNVEESNTGYIVGGSHSGLTTTGTYPSISGLGDSRISYFDISRIGNNSFNTTSISNVRTITTINNEVKTINLDDSDYSSYKDGFSKYTSSELDLLKNALYSNYAGEVKSSYVYGIHFMNASINKDNTINVKNALINGDPYPNYEMPEDCIDFRLKQSGFINFFAGSYFATGNKYSVSSRNDCFFSLNEIKRDSNHNIIAINHIVKIYGKRKDNGKVDTSETFVYQYETADPITGSLYSNGSSIPTGYVMLFDKDWIETDPENNKLGQTGNNLSSIVGYIYYFEIPVNDGEFALGSVAGKSGGAYLMYLDIGANAAIVDRTQITQETDNTISNHVYVNGIQILSANSGTINASQSYVAIIPAGTYNTIAINSTSISGASLNMSYNGTGGTISQGTLVPRIIDSTTHYMTDVGASQSQTTKVLKFIDYNNGTDSAYEVTIKKVGSAAASYEVYRILNKGVTDNTLINVNAAEPEYGLLIKGTGNDDGYGVAPASANAVIADNSISFRTGNDDKILEYYYNNIPWEAQPVITEINAMQIGEVQDGRTINSHVIYASTNKFEDNDYYLQHVYRMTGNTITVSITAPNGATATDYNNTIYVSIYSPNNTEANNDTPPNYVFIINGTTIGSTSTTVTVTASAYSG